MIKKNPYEMLLDENNQENIVFYDEKNNSLEFEQVAVISLAECRYAILHPVNMGYEEDEVIVYSIYEENGKYELLEVEDKDTLEEVSKVFVELAKEKKRS